MNAIRISRIPTGNLRDLVWREMIRTDLNVVKADWPAEVGDLGLWAVFIAASKDGCVTVAGDRPRWMLPGLLEELARSFHLVTMEARHALVSRIATLNRIHADLITEMRRLESVPVDLHEEILDRLGRPAVFELGDDRGVLWRTREVLEADLEVQASLLARGLLRLHNDFLVDPDGLVDEMVNRICSEDMDSEYCSF